LPENTADVLRSYRRVAAAELNAGQLRQVLRAQYLADVEPLNKVQGRPFRSSEVEEWVTSALS
jgi:2-oxoglutarate ferredoxin oxidoreductase subunit alpha